MARVWAVLLVAARCIAGVPLAVKLLANEAGLTAADLNHLRSLQAAVEAGPTPELFVQNRSFGEAHGGAGHETVFVHGQLEAAAPGLLARLRRLAQQLDAASGWGVFGAASSASDFSITPRCLEFIRYRGGRQGSDSIGWHHDGATLMTMVVMLSDREAFAGGTVELRGPRGSVERHDVEQGDALAWRGWTNHRVSAVTGGVREAFVVEWWVGSDCTETDEPRGEDTVEGIVQALEVDNSSAFLHRLLGESVCTQLPCKDEQQAHMAEDALRRAVALADDGAGNVDYDAAMSLLAYGYFLVSSEYFPQRAEAARALRRAMQLDSGSEFRALSPAWNATALPEGWQQFDVPPMLCRVPGLMVVCRKVPLEIVGLLNHFALGFTLLLVFGTAAYFLDQPAGGKEGGGEAAQPVSQGRPKKD